MKVIKESEISVIENPLIIDLRDPSDFSKEHINNSLNLNYNEALTYVLKELKSRNIILKCYVGQRSRRLGISLMSLGYINIYILK